MYKLNRRRFVSLIAVGAAFGLAAPLVSRPARARITIIGGGAGGAAAAWSLKTQRPELAVTLIERDPTGLVPQGRLLPQRKAIDFHRLSEAGVHVALDEVTEIDWDAARVTALSGRSFDHDALVLAPGVTSKQEPIEGYDARAAHLMPHAWLHRGQEVGELEARVKAVPEGGTVVVRVPAGDISHPVGPYERAVAMAKYLSVHNPRAKVLILDGKETLPTNALPAGLRTALAGRLEWLPASAGGEVLSVSAEDNLVVTSAGSIRADLINFIPAQTAGRIAASSGLCDDSGWCPVTAETGRSTLANAWIVGDAQAATHKTADVAQHAAEGAVQQILRLV